MLRRRRALGPPRRAAACTQDVWLRGKLEVEPGKQQARYSKKFRLPWLNTGLAKLAVTADWSAASSGVLGRMLGLQLHWQHQSLVASSVVRKSPDYAINVQPRLTLPSFGVPASLAVKVCVCGGSGQAVHAQAVTHPPALWLRSMAGHLDLAGLGAEVTTTGVGWLSSSSARVGGLCERPVTRGTPPGRRRCLPFHHSRVVVWYSMYSHERAAPATRCVRCVRPSTSTCTCRCKEGRLSTTAASSSLRMPLPGCAAAAAAAGGRDGARVGRTRAARRARQGGGAGYQPRDAHV